MKRNPKEDFLNRLKIPHQFVEKSSKSRRPHLCKICKHTRKHRLHRDWVPPEGTIERLTHDTIQDVATAAVARLGKPSPWIGMLERGDFPKEAGDTIKTEANESFRRFTCPKCGSGVTMGRQEREGSGVVHGCPICRTEWSESFLIKANETTDAKGSREQASTGAVRSQLYPKGAKFPARYDLMMRNAAGMRRLAETWGEGQAKYGNDNWLNGFPESVMISHTEDHIRLYLAGDKSEDHLAHAAWNLLALCWIEENKPELLDLTKPEQKL